MKKLSLLMLVFVLAGVSRAQDLSQELSWTMNCHENLYSVHFTASENVDYVFIWYEAGADIFWATLDEGFNKTVNLSYGEEIVISVHAFGSETAFYLPEPDCGDNRSDYVSPPPGIECLGVPYPSGGIFVVDGNNYTWHNVLSFVVPIGDIWRWELYIEGQLIIVFEQTEPGNCHITEDYRA